MKIIVHDYAGHPFEVQLSRSLAHRGHTVLHLYAGYNQTPRGALAKTASDSENYRVEPLFIREPLKKYSFTKRWLQEREYGGLLARQVRTFQPDLVISANTPLDAQAMMLNSAREVGASFIFWMQDAIGVATHKLLMRKWPILGHSVGRYYLWLEQRIARQSDIVVPITEDFVPMLARWNVDRDKIRVVPNWAPLEEIPVFAKRNPWSVANKLADKTVFLYTGTLGLKHNPDLLLQLALRSKEKTDAVVVVVSEGPGASWLQQKKEEYQLSNLIFFGYQPMEVLPKVLGAGDVLVSILEPEAGVFSVPSKVLSYLCAQRPILLAVPEENLSAKIISRNNAGRVVPPRDVEAFINAGLDLINRPEERAAYACNARRYAEQNFDIEKITDKFEALLARQPNQHYENSGLYRPKGEADKSYS